MGSALSSPRRYNFVLFYSNAILLNFLRTARSVLNVILLIWFFCTVFQQRKWEVVFSAPLAEDLFNSRGKKLI